MLEHPGPRHQRDGRYFAPAALQAPLPLRHRHADSAVVLVARGPGADDDHVRQFSKDTEQLAITRTAEPARGAGCGRPAVEADDRVAAHGAPGIRVGVEIAQQIVVDGVVLAEQREPNRPGFAHATIAACPGIWWTVTPPCPRSG